MVAWLEDFRRSDISGAGADKLGRPQKIVTEASEK